MKLSKVVLRERIPDLGSSSLSAPLWDLSFEAGLVSAVREGVDPIFIPLATVLYMRPLEAPKGAKK